MALATAAVLFVFRMPDVRRLFLLAIFPTQALLTVAGRMALRRGMQQVRRTRRNVRNVLILGAGPRGQAFATRLESHPEFGLRLDGFLGTRRSSLLLVALVIRGHDGGSVLFTEEWVGLHGRRFNILKFGSMTVGADERLPELLDGNETRRGASRSRTTGE